MSTPAVPVDQYKWELYNLAEDYSQAKDLAAEQPEKLKNLQALWLTEAERNNVLPLDHRFGLTRSMDYIRWKAARNTQSSFVYWGAGIQVGPEIAPNIAARGFSITADLDVPAGGTGVVLAMGSWFGGWSFYLKDGKPMVFLAASTQPKDQFWIESGQALKARKTTLRYEFKPEQPGLYKGGEVRIFADDQLIGEGHVDRTIVMMAVLGETKDIGLDSGVPVTEDYLNQGVFPGTINKVELKLEPMWR